MKQFFKKIQNFLKSFESRSRRGVIFADTKFLNLNENEKYDIILSPIFYWIKRENLPVKYAYQAKNYAHSLFEGSIVGGDYSYIAKKIGDEFLLFAYNDSEILNKLENIGVKPSQIGKVYFSQSEFENINEPILINEQEVLVKNDGIFIKLPINLVKHTISLKDAILGTKRSKNTINLNQFSQIIDEKSLKLVLVILSVFILLYGAEYFILSSALNKQTQAQAEIYKKYKLPSTSIQINAVLKKIDSVALRQRNIRDKIYYLLKIPLAKGEYFVSISLKDTKLLFVLNVLSQDKIENFKKYLEKEFKIKSIKVQNTRIDAELAYE